jgi:SAM-dependent methyltransferase
MSDSDRIKWDEHYRGRPCRALAEPNPLLAEWLSRIQVDAASPLAADVACGSGRHALYLARRGWRVDAMDISAVALEGLAAAARAESLDVTCLLCDFEPAPPATIPPFEPDRYHLAVVMRYTNLPLIGMLAGAIRPGGYLIAEAYLKSSGPDGGPNNPAYRVAPGEFEAVVGRSFDLVFCHETVAAGHAGRDAAVVQVVGRRRPD